MSQPYTGVGTSSYLPPSCSHATLTSLGTGLMQIANRLPLTETLLLCQTLTHLETCRPVEVKCDTLLMPGYLESGAHILVGARQKGISTRNHILEDIDSTQFSDAKNRENFILIEV